MNLNLSSTVVGFYLILVIILNLALGPYYGVQNIVVLILLPGLFLIAFLKDIKTINIGHTEILIFLIIVVFSFMSVFYYLNHSDFEEDFRKLVAAFLAAFIPISLNKSKNYDLFFHLGYVLSILFLIFIEYKLGNFTFIGFTSMGGLRDRFFYNANYYSYTSYFANISMFYLYLRYKNKLFFILLMTLPILFIILAFITQSRSGILFILLINTVFWFFINKTDSGNKLIKIGRSIMIVSAAVMLMYQFANIYLNSQIKNRVDNSGDDSRLILAKEGIEVFMDHPFFGVGLGQFPKFSIYHLFTHNSYAEILAEMGIVGGILITFLYGIPLYKSIKQLRRNFEVPLYRLNFLFFTTFLIYNNFYVFYKFSFSMMYFFLIVSIQNKEILKNK